MSLKVACIVLALVWSSLCSVAFGSLPDVSADAKPQVRDETTAAPLKTSTTTITTPTTQTTAKTTTEDPKTTTLAPKTTTPDPKTTTPVPKTTTPDPKTTTPEPKTTTPAPKTTTPEPKTTTPEPKTTTPEPKTTTPGPAPVTTTVAPPPEQAGTWYVENGNITCVIAKLIVHVNVTYPTNNGTNFVVLTSEGVNATRATGICENKTQSIDVPLVGGHSLIFIFDSNDTTKHYAVNDTKLLVNVTVLKDLKDNVTELTYALKSTIFETPLTKSYKCSRVQNYNLTSPYNLTAELTLKDAQIEAFHHEQAVNFGDAQDCETADTPDIVPIAVGVTLGVMILIVLVAYLVGRRRSQSGGYVSM